MYEYSDKFRTYDILNQNQPDFFLNTFFQLLHTTRFVRHEPPTAVQQWLQAVFVIVDMHNVQIIILSISLFNFYNEFYFVPQKTFFFTFGSATCSRIILSLLSEIKYLQRFRQSLKVENPLTSSGQLLRPLLTSKNVVLKLVTYKTIVRSVGNLGSCQTSRKVRPIQRLFFFFFQFNSEVTGQRIPMCIRNEPHSTQRLKIQLLTDSP